MVDGAAIGGFLCVLVVGLLIGTLIGAIILRAAVSLFNKMAGGADSEGAVPEPEFGKAMGITFVTTLVNMVAGFMIGLVIGGAAAAGGAGVEGAALVAQLVPSAPKRWRSSVNCVVSAILPCPDKGLEVLIHSPGRKWLICYWTTTLKYT